MSDNRELATLPLEQAIDLYAGRWLDVLPPTLPVKLFIGVMKTAISLNPDLAKCDRRSLFNASARCAKDGLLPDGREAALVPYGGVATYIPMVAGMRRLIMEGGALSVTSELICQNDRFRQTMGDEPGIEHEPPSILSGQERGAAVGAYCIIRLKTGDSIREVMTKAEIEKIRTMYSKSTRDDAPWKRHWDEMARKTVIRKAAKQVAWTNNRVARVFDREIDNDDYIPLPETPLPPRPTLEDVTENGPAATPPRTRQRRAAPPPIDITPPTPAPPPTTDDTPPFPGDAPSATSEGTLPPEMEPSPARRPVWRFSDATDEEYSFDDMEEAIAVYSEMLEKADGQGREALWERGDELRGLLARHNHQKALNALVDHYHSLMPAAPTAPAAAPPQANGHDHAIPFDGVRSQAWYKEARMALQKMIDDKAPAADFAAFKDVNKGALDILHGPGDNAFRSLWDILNKQINFGLQRT